MHTSFPFTLEQSLRLQLVSQSSVITACGIAEWVKGDRYTTQHSGSFLDKPIVRFPDCSDLYEMLMDDLEQIESQCPEVTSAFYYYSDDGDTLHFNAFLI